MIAKLLEACAKGQHIKDVTIELCRAGGDKLPYLEIKMEQVEKFLAKMYKNVDFTYTVTREFVKQCQNPILILPDDMPPHPYKVAMECAMLAPNAEVSMYPWQEPKERIPLAVRQVHSFLKAHKPGVV